MDLQSLQGYSRYVSLMKVVLPVGILLTLALSFGWPYILSLSKDGFVLLDMSRSDIRENHMVHPQYMSTDNKGQPYQVKAEWAKQRTETLADLTAPQGLMTVVEGDSFDLKAKNGVYDMNGKLLGLDGGVVLTSTDGYHVQTEKAQISLDTKVIEGNVYVEGEGPTGSIKGQNGFKVESRPGGKVLTLKGPSRVIINTAALKKHKGSHVE
ncbi:MAG: LPS export ABC transporter periplasmic protein LptC [Proteobacteria bacterium]|nr:LPS export ABC transporter periplasmic protein LptC [Pseudomonadota bacterium]